MTSKNKKSGSGLANGSEEIRAKGKKKRVKGKRMALEDDFCDIIKKARRGEGLSAPEAALRSGLPERDLQALEAGKRNPDSEEVQSIASALGIRPAPLKAVAIEGWEPHPPPKWAESEGPVVCVMGDIGGYAVKGYVLYDESTRDAVFIDTAYNPDQMLAVLKERGLKLAGVCLTHGHTDHAEGLDRIHKKWPVPVYLGQGDWNLLPSKPPETLLASPFPGQTLQVGGLSVECLVTPGHTPGGTCYRIRSKTREVCFVGDTLFAGSIGRSMPPSLYPSHLSSVRHTLLKLSAATVLLPGHGPATTVREELDHNPFA